MNGLYFSQRKHGGFLDSQKRKISQEERTLNDLQLPSPKRRKVENSENERPITFLSQKLLDEKIVKYFITEMVPLYTIEKDSFRELVLVGRSSKLKVMSRKTLVSKIDSSFQNTKKYQ